MRSAVLVLLAAALSGLDLVPASGTVLNRPVWVGTAPGVPGELVVAEQGGRVLVLPDDQALDRPRTALDLGRRTRTDGEGYSEEGLLALAFHPGFAANGRLFAWWMPRGGARRTVLAEFRCATAPFRVVDETPRELLTVDQPFANHNGGDLRFGPDGMLYISLGDGGGGGDPVKAGQRRDTLLGKILRIDVNRDQGYAVPADNPFVGQSGVRSEIWAWGLRNPWRMAFGPDGALWCADVGQNAREEVNLIVRGGNYGWNQREGTVAYKDGRSDPSFIEPVTDYPHSEGRSVTGGEVYAGAALPALRGRYVFGDWTNGRIWSVSKAGDRRLELASAARPSSFGNDGRGELVLCDYQGGRVLRLVP
jgi:quinoprotein glucose dehydrogenase